jgi:nucleotide-binding universal stress UspA family protein
VLVSVGTAEHALVDVQTAIHVARAFGAQVTVLHVVSQVPLMFTGLAHMQMELESFLASDLAGAQLLAKARHLITAAGLTPQLHLREGLVCDEIVAEARTGHYDLLVIGAHGGSGEMELWLDDIADHVVRHCSISTLVVRGEPRWLT